jgi:4,5-DOPA dioxygenase extradiol
MTRRRQVLQAALGTLSTLADLAAAATEGAVRRLPVLFIGHGSPMNAIQDNAFSRFLRGWAANWPLPKALLVVSAHWLTPGVTAVGMQARPKTLHDFGGFAQAPFDMPWPAPGSPEFAREAMSVVRRTRVQATEEWGLDLGNWTVLHHLYPEAQVPVFQLSIDDDKPAVPPCGRARTGGAARQGRAHRRQRGAQPARDRPRGRRLGHRPPGPGRKPSTTP